MSRYFGGTDFGTVVCAQQTTFRALVDDVFNHPIVLNVTRARYDELASRERDASLTREERVAAKRERDDSKKTAYLVAAGYETPTAKRKAEGQTLQPCDLVFLDIDDPAQAFGFTQTEFSPLDALPYSYVCYHSASSRKDAPRVRVVVAAEAIPIASYGAAVAHVAGLLGLPDVTAESLVPNQPMYRPVVFSDDDILDSHPVIASRHALPHLTVAALVDAPAARVSGRSTPTAQGPSDDLSSIVGPVIGLTIEQARAMLLTLSADEYHTWVETACALKHQFGEEGYALFLEWSAKAEKFTGEEDCGRKWKSVKQHPGRLPVTLRTTLKRAKEAGFNAAPVSQNQLKAAQEWVAATPSDQLLREGPMKVLEFDLLSTLERDSLEKRIVQKLRDDGHNVGLPAMRKAIAKAHAEKARADDETVKKERTKQEDMPPWARGLIYVAESNEFVHRASGNRFATEALNNYYSVKLMEGADSGKPAVLPQHYLLNTLEAPRVNTMDYDPSNPTQAIVEETGRRSLNTYRMTYPESDNENAAKAGDLLLGHLRKLLNDEREVGIMASFMACMVQEPGRKVRWAPVIQSAHGAGKGVLELIMSGVLGKGNTSIIEGKSIVHGGKFTSWSWGVQLCFIDEIYVTGENRKQIMDAIKPCVTNDRISVEYKGKDLEQKVNRQNYIMFTNHFDALPIDRNERRYFVVHSRIQHKAQADALLDSGHFGPLVGFAKAHPGAFRAFLETWPYHPEFDPDGHAPNTAHRTAMADAASSNLQKAVRRLADGPVFRIQKAMPDIRAQDAKANYANVGSVLMEMGYRELQPDMWTLPSADVDDLLFEDESI